MTSLECRSKEYKNPHGAVASGDEICFFLKDCSEEKVSLLFRADWEEDAVRIPMTKNDTDFLCTHVCDTEGLYFYCFETAGGYLTYDEKGQRVVSAYPVWAQQTVYDRTYKAADSFFGATAYQIFPDRFAVSGDVKKIEGRRYHEDLNEIPNWRNDPDGEFRNLDFYGGDLKGIIGQLDYIASLGVELIYLNPIFSSPSNHRYDTSDYFRIDPQLGDEEDLEQLCREAGERGIKVILDGVFSHTGDDSVYFDRYGRYDGPGAYQSKESPYYDWYKFRSWPDDYTGWWGIRTLPEVDEETPSYVDFITGENGVVDYWMKKGISGFRLDVADELPDSFIEKVRQAIKRVDPDGLLIGEVWEDASNKISYGERRRYFWGRELDGVMGYTFRTAVLDFIAGHDAETFARRIEEIALHYPKQMLNACLNMLSSHDTPRAINFLAAPDGLDKGREYQAGRMLSRDEYLRGVEMVKLAYALMFFLPGIPMIYYGDEAGMQGYGDPFCRGFFLKENADLNLTEAIKKLGSLRRELKDILAQGDIRFFRAQGEAVGFYRLSDKGNIAFLLNMGEVKTECLLEDGSSIAADPWTFSVTRLNNTVC